MKGKHHIEVKNRNVSYKFDLSRNITIIKGDSGTGKTTLYGLISDYARLGTASGVNLSCDKPCVALQNNALWREQLMLTKDSIVFIDEGARYLSSKEFAKTIKRTDNYYVIFNRETLRELPYSVNEIYKIKTSGKYHTLTPLYPHGGDNHIYSSKKKIGMEECDALLTEDSKSGFQFYSRYLTGTKIECLSSGSNSAIFGKIKEFSESKFNNGKRLFVIADGAAFGAEIDRVMKLSHSVDFILCLPESFEWLILRSGLIQFQELEAILANPAEYVESAEYFSWENYFENCLIANTANTQFAYTKKKINPVFLIPQNAERIMEEVRKK